MTRKWLGRMLCLLLALGMATTAYAYDGNAPISDEPVELSMMTTNSSTLRYDFENMSWCQEILKRANVKLDMELIDSSAYNDVLKTRLAAGVDLPDIVFLGDGFVDTSMTYINAGLFVDMTPYFEKDGYNLKKRYETEAYADMQARLTCEDGSMYYVPIFNTPSVRSIVINLDWLKELGMEVPTTTDEFYAYLKAVKETDLNGNGKNDEVPLFLRPGFLQCFSAMWGIDLTVGYAADEQGVVSCSYANSNYRSFLEYFNKLYTEGLLYNEFATSTSDMQNALLSNNRAGSLVRYATGIVGTNQVMNPDFDFENGELVMDNIAPLTGPFGDKAYNGLDLLAGTFAITRDCKNPEMAFRLLDYFYSEEAINLLYAGIEGVDYELVDGVVAPSQAVLLNENNYVQLQGSNFGGFPRVLGSVTLKQAQSPLQQKIDASIKDLSQYVTLPLSACFESPEEIEVTQMYAADLNSYFEEMLIAFVTGTRSLDEFDTYLKELDALHVNDMVAVYQAKYDRMTK